MKSPIQLIPILWRLGLSVSCAAATMSGASAAVYPSMAPIARYQSADQAAEIAFARSAAPASISGSAQILALGEHGYETAVKGGDGFVCLVVRSWDLNFNNPRILESKNPFAAMFQCRRRELRTAQLPGENPAGCWPEIRSRGCARVPGAYKRVMPAPGSVCYMMSRQAYLNDGIAGPWYSHVMFFGLGKPADWGANLDDSPMAADAEAYAPVTIFMVIVQKWSDGTPNRKQ